MEAVHRVNIQLENDKKKLEQNNNSLKLKVESLASDIQKKQSDLVNTEISLKLQRSMYETNLQKMTRENESWKLEKSINKVDIFNDCNAKINQLR